MSQLRQDTPPRRRPVPLSSVLAALAIAAATCAGCSSSNSGSAAGTPSAGATVPATASGSASAALCADLQALNGDISQLKSLDPSSVTPQQMSSILVQANTNLQDAAQNATGAAATKLNAIKVAYAALTTALTSLPTTDTATQAYQSVEPQIVALVSALDSAADGVGCPSAAVTPSIVSPSISGSATTMGSASPSSS